MKKSLRWRNDASTRRSGQKGPRVSITGWAYLPC
nr:MAG TPA: hypothetical protein [Caudoviricetes sp.]DAY98892.1 MAG TPA: hypothetical protein [Caudoviricetes sp.]